MRHRNRVPGGQSPNRNLQGAMPENSLEPRPAAARRVSIQRLATYEPAAVERAVRAVLEPLGGIGAFVMPGARVVLKPNLLMPSAPERAVCTHPEIIRAVARLAREVGAAVVEVTDSPGVGSARRCARHLGLGDDEPFVVHDADEGVDVAPIGTAFHRLRLIRRLRDADLVINLPKAKTHGQMVVTAAVKNSFGAVVGMEKAQWHFRAGKNPADFARLLLHVHTLIAPRLSILDAVVGMEGNGPSAGDPRPLGLVIASADAHALDAVLARIWGLDLSQVFTLAVARGLHLLPSFDGIEIVGPPPDDLRPRPTWRLARPAPLRGFGGPAWLSAFLERLMTVRPEIDRGACVACGECARVCAAHAIALNPDGAPSVPPVMIDRDQCIACFCCQEMCPEGAIRVSAGLAARLFGWGTR
jgi:uncharacterized protein (DUF362 family)/NAD-dependent dihydropyrimidine dehydrogenase PreA subunit